MPDISETNRRTGDILQLLVLVSTSFLLGRQTVMFTGAASAWFQLGCAVIVIGLTLHGLIRSLRASA